MKGLPVEALGKDHPNLAVTLQKTENRDFSAGATSPLPLTDTAEVGLVNLYLTGKLPDFLLPIGGYTGPYDGIVTHDGLAVYAQVPRHTRRRDHQPEKSCYLSKRAPWKPVGPFLGRKFLTAFLALPAAVSKSVRRSMSAGSTVDMSNPFACSISDSAFATLESITLSFGYHSQTIIAWSDLMD